jgi:hypothetical protein
VDECEGEVHHGADLDLAVDGDGLVLDGVETQDGCGMKVRFWSSRGDMELPECMRLTGLGQVDDGGTHQRTEDTTLFKSI